MPSNDPIGGRGRALSEDIDINISAVFMSRKIPGANSVEAVELPRKRMVRNSGVSLLIAPAVGLVIIVQGRFGMLRPGLSPGFRPGPRLLIPFLEANEVVAPDIR